jgi:chromosome segregation ATPase
VTELRQQLLSCDQALASAQQSAQRQQEEQERLVARLSAVQGECSRLQGQLEGQTAARRAAEDQVRMPALPRVNRVADWSAAVLVTLHVGMA